MSSILRGRTERWTDGTVGARGPTLCLRPDPDAPDAPSPRGPLWPRGSQHREMTTVGAESSPHLGTSMEQLSPLYGKNFRLKLCIEHCASCITDSTLDPYFSTVSHTNLPLVLATTRPTLSLPPRRTTTGEIIQSKLSAFLFIFFVKI